MDGWRYYNHAMIPTCAPHEEADLSVVESGEIWNHERKPLLARWTSDFDCGYETNWWYVIKDTPFDINTLKAKRRYEIKKGMRYFDVRIIDPREYREELYCVQVDAFSAYPKKYRPTIDKQKFVNGIDNWTDFKAFGAFLRESNELCGYSLVLEKSDNWVDFSVQKTKPKYEKYQINAALVEKIVSHYEELLFNGGVLCDGEKSIIHETNFQAYLEKNFGFRKAYCHLNIRYNSKVKLLIKILYPFRTLLRKLDRIGIVHNINGVLKMEEVTRNERE